MCDEGYGNVIEGIWLNMAAIFNSRALKDLGMVKDALPEEVTFKRGPKG